MKLPVCPYCGAHLISQTQSLAPGGSDREPGIPIVSSEYACKTRTTDLVGKVSIETLTDSIGHRCFLTCRDKWEARLEEATKKATTANTKSLIACLKATIKKLIVLLDRAQVIPDHSRRADWEWETMNEQERFNQWLKDLDYDSNLSPLQESPD